MRLVSTATLQMAQRSSALPGVSAIGEVCARMSQGAELVIYGSLCVRWGAHVRVQCAAAEWLTARCTWVGEAGRVMRSARCIHPLQLACATRPDNAKGAALFHSGCEGFLSFQMQW